MIFFYLIFSLLIHKILPATALNHMSCPLNDKSQNGIINFKYERTELAIYSYNQTKLVNFLINDAKIDFTGIFSNEGKDSATYEFVLQTSLEGIAALKKHENGELIFTECQLDLKKLVKYRTDVSLAIQEKIIDLAQSCITPTLCSGLGSVQDDDYIRGKIEPHDFAENSVMYKVLKNKFPNLNLPDPQDKNAINLQATLNLLVDFFMASLISQISDRRTGQIKLPDVNEPITGVPFISEGYFKLEDGTFGSLKNFTRSKDIIVTNKGLEFSVRGGFELPKANVHFNKYALKYGVINNNGKINIDIDGIHFCIKIVMNYNTSPCKISVTNVHSKLGEVTFALSESGIFDSMINNLTNNLINKYICNLINFIENKVEETINNTLNNFDCENYRP